MGDVSCMTDGSINADIINWRTSYEGVFGYLTMFKKTLYTSEGREKEFSTGKKEGGNRGIFQSTTRPPLPPKLSF